ncbi:MAG: PH domain-containing protein [Acidimicrobiales bacterium]
MSGDVERPASGDPDLARWRRLHPLSPLVRASRTVLALLIALALSTLSGSGSRDGTGHIVDAVLVVIAVVGGLVSWLVTRWRVEVATLRLDTGLLRRRSTQVPLSRLQAVDVVRPPLARALGLAELRLRVAGSSRDDARLAYLPEAEATSLRAQLLAIAHGVRRDAPAPVAAPMLSVPTTRLVASVALSAGGVLVPLVVATVIALALVDPTAVRGGGSGAAALLFGAVASLWRRVSGPYHFTVAEAPDGLRLHSGLLQTVAETIPAGRVQAVRKTEPLLWRPLGWCRLEVEVASRQRGRRRRETSRRMARALLPVASHAEADLLLARILPGPTPDLSPPPARARLKSPVRYRFLRAGFDGSYAVTASGRVRRSTEWVPLAKVQSLRLVQGPLQRRMRLASVHVDTAGRAIHASFAERDASEAMLVLEELSARCRLARERQAGSSGIGAPAGGEASGTA